MTVLLEGPDRTCDLRRVNGTVPCAWGLTRRQSCNAFAKQWRDSKNPTVSWLVSARSDLATVYDSLKRPEDAARWRAEIDSVEKQAAAKGK